MKPESWFKTRAGRLTLGMMGVAAWYLFWIGVFTWPVLLEPGHLIIGEEHSGAWRTLWAHDWTRTRLQTDGSWPLSAPEISFPRGGPFCSIAPLNDFLALPLIERFGLVQSFNLLVVFHILLACTGAHALARTLGCSIGASLVAGSVFGFNTFFLTYSVSSAVVETSTIGWIAWFFVAMVRLIKKPGIFDAIAAGVLFAAAGLASFYWALMVTLMVPLIALPGLHQRHVEKKSLKSIKLWGFIALSIVVATSIFMPLAADLMATYMDTGGVLQDYADRKQALLKPETLSSLGHDFATSRGYLIPGKEELVVHEDMDRLVQGTYAGWLALVLAGMGLGRGRLRWGGLALAGLVLSLGPFLFVSLDSWRSEPVIWWLWLRDLVPPIRMVTSYVRFSVFFFLGLGVLAAFGSDRLAERIRPRLSAGAFPVYALLIGLSVSTGVLYEQARFSPVNYPLPSSRAEVPEASLVLATLPKPGAVLDWPQRYPGRSVEVSRYFYYQSVHGRPIPYDFAPTSYMPGLIESNPFFARLERLSYGAEYNSGAWNIETWLPMEFGIQDLDDMGFSYLVIHTRYLDPSVVPRVMTFLKYRLEHVHTTESGDEIFEIGVIDDWEIESSLEG
jgi:hypothetical protein